ncbi:unnamed protein product, partial [Thlaspi arvense]
MTKVKGFSPVNNMPYLPDDLVLNCLARVLRLHYPILFLVSKRFSFLIASIELYQTRTFLGRIESCLYVCLRFSSRSNVHWFTLCRRPTQTPNPNPKPNPIRRWFTPPCFRPTNRTRKDKKMLSDNLMWKARTVAVPKNMEMFNPETQIWKQVTYPKAEILGERYLLRSLAIDGKLYLFGDKPMVYNPNENGWDV